MIVFASKRLQEHRKAVCNACEFSETANVFGTPRCKQCGCFLNPKIAVYASECPQKRWEITPIQQEPV